MDPRQIIEELEQLNTFTRLTVEEIREEQKSFKYTHINHYLESLIHAAKPETISAELLRHLADDIFKEEGFSEVRLSVGFGDFIIQENKINPILLELKPAFVRTEDKNGNPTGIVARPIVIADHKEQVQKYLTVNDYLVLTNLRKASLFSRDALVDFKPFYELEFTELLKMYLENESFWDNVRRLEDLHVKPELETIFFQDLNKWFEAFKTVRFNEITGLSHDELVVLLINKIIFIKTLEDYALIPYKFLDEEYFSKVKKWEFKSNYKVFNNFFTELEDWFFEYYDTELFRIKIWDFLEKDEENLMHFREVFETVLGLGKWEYTFGKGLIHYNYRKIDEDVFGKAYETFIARQRKDSGIFYTHRLITQYMSEKIVKQLFEPAVNEILACFEIHDYRKALEKMNEMYLITIADTASGSGSFLIKVFREIYTYYQLIYSKLQYANEIHGMFEVPAYVTDAQKFIDKTFLNNKRKLISLIILRHIHAIDIDERALEIAKTNLWKEAVKIEKSLFRYSSLGQNNNHILPNLQFNFHQADSLYDLPLQVQTEEISKNFKDAIAGLHSLRKQYLDNTTHPELVDNIFNLEYPVRHYLDKLDESIPNPSLICLKFFYIFFDESGDPLPVEQQGFSGIISNPPWEAIKPVKKEFAQLGKMEIGVLEFESWFSQKLNEDKDFKNRWDRYVEKYKFYSDYLKQHYIYQDAGDFNYYKFFIERDLQLIKENGFLSVLVPSGIQTDKGCSELRKFLIEENTLEELYSFENRGFYEKPWDSTKVKIFPDVDNRYKFSVTFCRKMKQENNYSFKAKFYLHDPNDLYNGNTIEVDKEMIERFSRDNLSIMEFKSVKDYELCRKLRNNKKLFGESGYRLRSEFHMTNDSHLFHPEPKKPEDALKLFEGKMIHQYNSNYTTCQYWISEKEARVELFDTEIFRIRQETGLEKNRIEEIFENNNLLLDYENWRLAYRAVGSSTNERSLICSVLPKKVFIGHSMNFLVDVDYKLSGKDSYKQIIIQPAEAVVVMALFNSLTLNYYVRNKISANLTMNFIYELPWPQIDDHIKKDIVNNSFHLLYHKSGGKLFDELGQELGIKPEKKIDEIRLRAELEVLIARELYGLTKEEWHYLTSTFIYGDESDTKKELDEIIELSKEIF